MDDPPPGYITHITVERVAASARGRSAADRDVEPGALTHCLDGFSLHVSTQT